MHAASTLVLLLPLLAMGLAELFAGLPLPRLECDSANMAQQPSDRVITADRVTALRRRMLARGLDAYIVPYSDEHQNEYVHEHDQRLRWLSGFTGAGASVAVLTARTASHLRDEAVLWTDARFLELADEQLDCSWELRQLRSPLQVADWLLGQMLAGDKVGADPRVILHSHWDALASRMYTEKQIELVEAEGLVDDSWRNNRPPRPRMNAAVHKMGQRGMIWQNRVNEVRGLMRARNADALVLTALDELAWLLNVRGRDLPHAPLLTAYLVLGQRDIALYMDRDKLTPEVETHLKAANCVPNRLCVSVRPYEGFWQDLARPTNRTTWWLSNHPRLGASKAVQTAVEHRHELHLEPSPVIALKSVKNAVEREGMRAAHALDGAAMCELLAFLEDQIVQDAMWSESRVAARVDFFRRPELSFQMTAFPTHVGYGQHGALPHYEPRATSDLFIGRESTVVIDSGGQYENGTTDVARTLHYGAPSRAHVEAYTRVLQGLIEISRASVPAALGAHAAHGLDSLARAAVWEGGENYGHPSGHGIGAFLNVHEEPNIFYGENSQRLQVGNFFTAEPGYYKKNDFGVRLENVLEVIQKKSADDPSAPAFYEFRTATLVPFDVKLIDVEMLSPQQRHWLNDYNARVRSEVGEVLKSKSLMPAFRWMMNHTLYIPEHCCPRSSAAAPAAPAAPAAVAAAGLLVALLLRAS